MTKPTLGIDPPAIRPDDQIRDGRPRHGRDGVICAARAEQHSASDLQGLRRSSAGRSKPSCPVPIPSQRGPAPRNQRGPKRSRATEQRQRLHLLRPPRRNGQQSSRGSSKSACSRCICARTAWFTSTPSCRRGAGAVATVGHGSRPGILPAPDPRSGSMWPYGRFELLMRPGSPID